MFYLFILFIYLFICPTEMCTVLVTALSRVTHLDLLFKTAFSPYFVNLLFCLVLFSETKSHVDQDSLQTTLCLKMTMN